MNHGSNPTATGLVFAAWAVSLGATLGALFLGEVMGMTPCVLCWYQRIAMFPLAVMLFMGLSPFDARCIRYALPLVAAGTLIAAYHCLLFWGLISEGWVACSKGASCKSAELQVAGFIPIPLLSLLAFALIGALLLTAQRKVKT
jgi:disulfide bond formation protein DsbB